jgi:hypothetical protein
MHLSGTMTARAPPAALSLSCLVASVSVAEPDTPGSDDLQS